MRRLIASLIHSAGFELGSDRALVNVRRDIDDLDRALALVDAVAARLVARAA
jgi:hypothetical protein